MSLYDHPALSYALALCPANMQARIFIDTLQECITRYRRVHGLHIANAITSQDLTSIRQSLRNQHDIALDYNPLPTLDSIGKAPLIDDALEKILQHDIQVNPPALQDLVLPIHILHAL